ncbi:MULTISPECIES: FMN reductase [Streptomyces]|uniref:FMN reductase n=1 Tax=Streptomyces TaxID=1883 RepID=UPI000A37DDBF|nr:MULTISPECIES: FMN reductase [Streptomyces]MBQ0883180.1 FMN reductase [Streptomyces sp. RT42]MDI3102390.1 FMN reductase [Streptomyces sp. AN-3]WDI19871.1 FMN reductase [Streptomyces enissocaesilis]WQC14321.1 FMN reductase [Streptomyces rochei]
MKLVAVSAGLSSPSSTRLLADRLTEAVRDEVAAQGHKTEVEVIELRPLSGAIANNLVTGFPPPPLAEAIEAVTSAHGLVTVTPVFSASYSGLFKSFFDLIDPAALASKPVLISATGGTPRHSLVLDHAMRPLFSYLKAVVLPTGVYAASEDWGSGSGAHTEGLSARVRRAGREMASVLITRATDPLPTEDATLVGKQLSDLRFD